MRKTLLSAFLVAFLGAPVQAQISVSLPSLTAGIGETISVPVNITGVESTGLFTSFQFRVISSSTNLVLVGQDRTGTLSGDDEWTTGDGVSNGNTLVGGFASSNDPIMVSGTLINLLFRLDAVEAGITIELQEFKISGPMGQLESNPAVPSSQFTISTDIDDMEAPVSFSLKGNYPNPFNPTTNIQFDLQQTSEVEITIMDILGREMLTIPSQTLAAGTDHAVVVDASSLPSGVYLYRVIAKSANDLKVASGLMTLIK